MTTDSFDLEPTLNGSEPLPSPESDVASQLAHLIPAMWRTIRRVTRTATHLPANESQVTILRLLLLYGEQSPSELATALGVARPTLSNLLKDLVNQHLVVRRVPGHDHRAAMVSATEAGRAVLETFRRERADALRTALESLPDDEQAAIRASVVALRHLERHLETLIQEVTVQEATETTADIVALSA